MPAPRSNHIATVALVGLGAALWSYGAHRLGSDDGMRFKPNPLGLKMSAYGQVIGMAMQGPIDLIWHEGEGHHHADHDHADCDAHCDHHVHDDEATDHAAIAAAAGTDPKPLRERVKHHLEELDSATSHRTNPNANSAAHKRYLRRQIENRLRTAYEFDPSNYGTYNAYHLFLSESQLGTTNAHGQQILRLSELTIDYCRRKTNDPQPALTAAAAAHDGLAIMFREPESYPRERFDRNLAIIDNSLARHLRILRQREADGSIELISTIRRGEMAQRFRLLLRLREADDATIRRIFGQPALQRAESPNQTNES